MRLKGYEAPQEGFIQKAKGVLGKFFRSLVNNAVGRGQEAPVDSKQQGPQKREEDSIRLADESLDSIKMPSLTFSHYQPIPQ